MSMATTRRLRGKALHRIVESNTYLGIRPRNCEYCGAPVGRMTMTRFRDNKACNQCGEQVYQGG